MMPAAKHFDPVLGIDIHIIQPPGPVPPVPVPHPFIGMVIDPMDYAPFIGATVMVGGIPRAQAGTSGKNIPSHIPIGGTFIKPPGNECEIFMGSLTVEADGDAFSYLALPVLSCQDVGMPPPPRAKKKSKTKSMVLPTSVVLSIPSGVVVGGPPTISLMALGMRAGMAAAGALFKKAKGLRKGKKPKKPKGKGKKKGKAKDNAPCGTDAHPVDVVTGACVDEIIDYSAPGECGFVWARYYDSSERERAGPMGRGWRHGLEATLEATAEGFRFTDETGMATMLPSLPNGADSVAAAGCVLRRVAADTLELVQPRQRTLRFRFAQPGRPAALIEVRRGSERLRIGYDGQGRALWVQDGGRRLYELQHDGAGRVAAVLERATEPPHAVQRALLRFHYDANGCLTGVADAFGNSAAYEYENGRLTCMRDRRGYRFYYVYDEAGRVVHTRGQDGLWDARLEYVPEAGLTIIRYGDGGEWLKFHDDQGMVTDVVQPDGGLLARRIDEEGRVAGEITPDGNEVQFEYDAFGAQEGRLDQFGRFMLPQWQDGDDPDFDAIGAPATSAEWEYGALIDPDCPTPLPRHWVDTLPAEARAALGIAEAPAGGKPRLELDALGRATRAHHPDGSTESWQYDAEGNCVVYVDRDGAVYRRGYTSWNLLGSETDPLGRTVTYQHSLRGNITGYTDPLGARTQYRRDPMERIAEVTRHGVVREAYRWTPASALVEKRDANGELLVATKLGTHGLPVLHKLASGGTHTLKYDAAGRPVLAATDDVEVTQAWDERGRRVQDMRSGKGTEHVFGNDGILATTVLARFSTRYEYRNRWDFDVIDPTGAVHSIRTHPAGLAVKQLSTGTTEFTRYGERGRCVAKVVTRGTTLWAREYRYSAAGDLREVRDSNGGSAAYTYDAAHRLIAERREGEPERRIRYDVGDNILSMPGIELSFLPGNRVQGAGSALFEHNARNHVSQRRAPDGIFRYVYDSADMLVRIERTDAHAEGWSWSAAYDPFARRAWKIVGGERTEFFWDGDRLSAEIAPNGSVRVYVYADHAALVPFMFVDYDSVKDDPDAGRRRFLFTNQIGVPLRVEDDAGRAIWSASADPYGRLHVDPAAQIDLNLRFPGHYYDAETRLHYNRFRYYSPELGRYLQSDPLGAAGGLNLYAYTANPLAEVDVLGLTCKDAKGKTKGKAEGPPHSKAKGRAESVKDIAGDCGMKPSHIKKMQTRCAKRGERMIVRASNPESLKWHKKPYNGKPCVAKPVDVKLKTAKAPDPHAGLVKKSKPDDVPPKGYEFDKDGVLVKKPGGNAVHGDYDMQHVSKADGTPVNTNSKKFQRDLNNDVCPDHPQFKHGANDDYRPDGTTPGRNPDPDEKYVVIEPDGTAKQIDGTHNLQRYYDENGLDWPYPDY